MEAIVEKIGADKVVGASNAATEDNGRVRMGTLSPSFPPAHSRPASVADEGQIRVGTVSPTFPPARVR